MSQEQANSPSDASIQEAEQSQEQNQQEGQEQSLDNSQTEQLGELKAKQESGEKLSKSEKKLLKELEIKVDGKVEKIELPFEMEDDPKKVEWMKKNLQMSKVAQKRMQEQAQLQKEVNMFIDELRKNPRKVLSDPTLGVDLKEIARQMIEEEISNSQKSPEQLKQEALEKELNDLKAEREKEKEEQKSKELERLQQQEIERYDMRISKALEGSPLPKSPYVVKKMADYMLLALENGIDANPEDVVPLVQQEIEDDIKQMFAAMPEEVVEKIIGKDILGKVRKKNLAKAPPPTPVKSAVKDVGAKKETKQESQKMSFKDFFKV